MEKNRALPKLMMFALLVPILVGCLVGCSVSKTEAGLAGKYKGVDGRLEGTEITFNEDGTCRWVMGTEFFEGTFEYDKSKERWNIYVKGSGVSFMGYDQTFFAKEDGDTLMIGGGRVNLSDTVFIKE